MERTTLRRLFQEDKGGGEGWGKVSMNVQTSLLLLWCTFMYVFWGSNASGCGGLHAWMFVLTYLYTSKSSRNELGKQQKKESKRCQIQFKAFLHIIYALLAKRNTDLLAINYEDPLTLRGWKWGHRRVSWNANLELAWRHNNIAPVWVHAKLNLQEQEHLCNNLQNSSRR